MLRVLFRQHPLPLSEIIETPGGLNSEPLTDEVLRGIQLVYISVSRLFKLRIETGQLKTALNGPKRYTRPIVSVTRSCLILIDVAVESSACAFFRVRDGFVRTVTL